MQVRLLGPVDVMLDGVSRPVNGLRRQAVLAVLALHDGQLVSTERLVELVWGASAPATAVNSLQTHISYLRGVLGSRDAIVARSPGYLLNLGDDGTDARAVDRLLRRGRQAADPVQGARELEKALAMWRGRPLAEHVGSAWLEEQSRRLDLLADEVRRALFEARLAAGEHVEIVAALEEMAAEAPLDEQVHGQLMLALYRCGRQADALAVFRRLRAVLAEQLGIDPGPALRDLETAILRQDKALTVPVRSPRSLASASASGPASASAAWSTPVSVPVPAQLPPAVPGFVGRAEELARLDSALDQAERQRSAGATAVVISAVSGMAGVGKTALALQWAHQVADRFPDGQLYVNLRGFGPGGSPVEPCEAVREFLDGFGVTPTGDASGIAAQVALYRSLLAGKRVLVMLDNARDAEQVRPLLPGSPGCLVIVTSRSDLAGLVAADGACPVRLDLLTTTEAGELLCRRLGEARVAGEPEAVAEIIERCARLPLALAIAAARAAARPGFPLAAIAAELRDAAITLDAFAGADLATDVRAVFSWSCQALSDDAARLFRLLGLHPGPGIGVNAAASLAGLPPSKVRQLLAQLADANLLLEYASGRYSLHDLLRAYAAELAQSQEGHRQRQAAMHRVLDYYLHVAHAAASLPHPRRRGIALGTVQPGVIVERLADTKAALAWFSAEHRTLVALSDLAWQLGLDAHAWQLAWVMGEFLARSGLWPEHHRVQLNALRAAEREGNQWAISQSHRALGLASAALGRRDEARGHFDRALRVSRQLGDHGLLGQIHLGLAHFLDAEGDYASALRHSCDAHDHFQADGRLTGQASALNGIGEFHAKLGQYRQALSRCEQALAMLQELDDTAGAAHAAASLAYIHRRLGDWCEAIACYRQARDLHREVGDSPAEADALTNIGDVYHDNGDVDAARAEWRQALDILNRLEHPGAEQVRAKLSRIRSQSAEHPSRQLVTVRSS